MLLERGSMRRWSGQSTCSSWCKLDARCPGSCGKYRRGPRCPEKNANKKHEREEGDHHHHNQKKKENNNHNKENNNIYTYIYTQLATESVRRVAYMMVTSVCSKREWTHLTLADSWWKPLTGNSFESYIWMFDLHPEHPELSCSKTKTCRGAVLCYRALPPRWPPVGSTTLWKRSCSSCRNPRTNAPTSGSPDQIQCHHRKHCTRRTLANLGLQLVRRAQNHAHRKRNNTVHWKNMKNYFLYLIRLQYVVVWISQTKI